VGKESDCEIKFAKAVLFVSRFIAIGLTIYWIEISELGNRGRSELYPPGFKAATA
jgi:hypothetical protein